MKDVVRCDKSWGAANRLCSENFRMGKPTFDLCYSEETACRTSSGGTLRMGGSRASAEFRLGDLWTSRDQEKVFIPESIGNKSEPGELKHLSTRRKGHQRDSVSSGERTRIRPMLLLFLTRTGWKAGPQRVTAPYG